MTTTRDKLEFTFLMARHTRATLRQCQALMRYAATLQRLAEGMKINPLSHAAVMEITVKRNRIQRKVTELCTEMCQPLPEGALPGIVPVFAGALLKIRVPSGFGDEGIVVPS